MDETAARAAFEEALRTYTHDFETFFLCRLLGLRFTYGEDKLVVDLPVRDFVFNPQGGMHGGISAFVLDVAMGHLLWHSLGTPGVTIEMKTQYLAPIRGRAARCEAKFIRKGRSICFLEAQLYDDQGVAAVVATSTWRVTQPKAKSIPTSKEEPTT